MEVQQQHGDEVRIIGVPGLADASSMERFVAETGTGVFPHIPDTDGDIWQRFGVLEHRTYVYIDDDGSFRTGTYGNLATDVEALIAS